MSTRSTTHLTHGDDLDAIVYRHSDGYPEGHGKDLLAFFVEVAETVQDTRFGDPSYLAAKLVVWLAKRFANRYERNPETGEVEYVPTGYLDFISVGIVREDPSDIEYRYVIDCSQMINGRPKVTVIETHGANYGGDKVLGEVADVLTKEPV